LSDWRGRYRSLRHVHPTEEFCYFDICEGGFYTIAGQISADARRQVWHVNLSFQLAGIPIEQGPLRQLCLALDPAITPVFRPRSERSVELHHIGMNQRPALNVIGFVVERDDLDSAQEEWVTGIVAKNPYHARRRPPSWWPPSLTGSELLLCDLRSWHPLSAIKRTYRLWSVEWAWTSDSALLRPRADWDDQRPRNGQGLLLIPVQRSPRPRKTRSTP
jgi:hypothetical protein